MKEQHSILTHAPLILPLLPPLSPLSLSHWTHTLSPTVIQFLNLFCTCPTATRFFPGPANWGFPWIYIRVCVRQGMGRSWQSSKLIILFKSLSETLILLSIRMCEWAKTELEGVKKEKEKGRESEEEMDRVRKCECGR